MQFNICTIIAVCVWLCGCVATGPDDPNLLFSSAAKNYEMVLKKTKLVPDPHAGWTTVKGPVVLHDNSFNGKNYMIRTKFDSKNHFADNKFQIQVSAYFPKRVYLKDAFSEGHALDTVVIDRERVDCGVDCTTIEVIGIMLREDELEQYVDDGFTFEVIGRRASITMTIPGPYVAAVLETHRRHRGPAP